MYLTEKEIADDAEQYAQRMDAKKLQKERAQFVREAAIHIYSAHRSSILPETAWESAKRLWDAKPEDC